VPKVRPALLVPAVWNAFQISCNMHTLNHYAAIAPLMAWLLDTLQCSYITLVTGLRVGERQINSKREVSSSRAEFGNKEQRCEHEFCLLQKLFEVITISNATHFSIMYWSALLNPSDIRPFFILIFSYIKVFKNKFMGHVHFHARTHARTHAHTHTHI
jgi:hypothetical protein